MKNIRKIIEIDEELCNGCGQCVPDCAEGSLKIIDGKARLVAENLCDGLGACLGSCPTGALKIVERPAEEFDEHAVEKYLHTEKLAQAQVTTPQSMDCGCSSAYIQTIKPLTSCQAANQPQQMENRAKGSLLRHWPVQIRLVPPNASFLSNADLLIAADCTAVASRNFQDRYLQDKVVLIGCPKFDAVDGYIQRFTEILRNNTIHSITVLIMEVPCCSAMMGIITKAVAAADSSVAVEVITLSLQGEELERKRWQ